MSNNQSLESEVRFLRSALTIYAEPNIYYSIFGHTELDPTLAQSILATNRDAIHCHAGRDGECNWPECPQKRNYQHICPLYVEDPER
jgi:hypothetical protein